MKPMRLEFRGPKGVVWRQNWVSRLNYWLSSTLVAKHLLVWVHLCAHEHAEPVLW